MRFLICSNYRTTIKLVFTAISSLWIASCASSSAEIAAAYVSPTQYQSFNCEQLSLELDRLGTRKSELAKNLDKKASSDEGITAVSLLLFWPAAFALGGNDAAESEYARLKGEYDAVQQSAIQKDCSLIIKTANEELDLATQAQGMSPVKVESITGVYLDNYDRSIKLKQTNDRISGYTSYTWNDAEIYGIREGNKLILKLNSLGTRGEAEVTILGDGTRLKGTIRMPNYAGRGGVWILSKLDADGEILKPNTENPKVITNAITSSRQSTQSEEDTLQYYGKAESEILNGTYDKNLWAKALVDAEGDENKRKARYIVLRAKQLHSEKNTSLPNINTNNNSLGVSSLNGKFEAKITSSYGRVFLKQQYVFKLTSNGHKVIGTSEDGDITFTGVLSGDQISFEFSSGRLYGDGSWEIKQDGDLLKGKWQEYPSDTSVDSGIWELEKSIY